LVAIVECAMSRSAAERFDTVEELGRALEPFGQGALFDVEQALSVRPTPSTLPGAATPVATESRFPDTAAQPIQLMQRARRVAVPLAISTVGALMFGWFYVSGGEPTADTQARQVELAAGTRVDTPIETLDHPAERSEARAQSAQRQQDALPVPHVTTLADAQLNPLTQELNTVAAAPALIGASARPEAEPIAQLDAEPAATRRDANAAAAISAPKSQLPAGLAATNSPTLRDSFAPAPVPPPGAAPAPAESESKAALKKKKAQAKNYAPPEIRINDFFQ
jgi:hypothetical protein